MSKKILVTGSSGYLGQHLTPRAIERYELYAAYHTSPQTVKAGRPIQLDLTDRQAVLTGVTDLAPQAIIHTAAINPGQADGATMMAVNATGTGYLAEAATVVGARLVHVSSDLVHDGRQGPYADDADPTPLNEYGRSKAAGEQAVLEACPQAAIVRTSLIYGLELMDRGTAGMVSRLERGEELRLFTDVLRQPVWVNTLSEALLKLTEIEFAGFLNVAGRQILTRAEFARRMFNWWQIDYPNQIRSGRAAEVSATIPLDLRLSVTKAEEILALRLPGVDEVLGQ